MERTWNFLAAITCSVIHSSSPILSKMRFAISDKQSEYAQQATHNSPEYPPVRPCREFRCRRQIDGQSFADQQHRIANRESLVVIHDNDAATTDLVWPKSYSNRT